MVISLKPSLPAICLFIIPETTKADTTAAGPRAPIGRKSAHNSHSVDKNRACVAAACPCARHAACTVRDAGAVWEEVGRIGLTRRSHGDLPPAGVLFTQSAGGAATAVESSHVMQTEYATRYRMTEKNMISSRAHKFYKLPHSIGFPLKITPGVVGSPPTYILQEFGAWIRKYRALDGRLRLHLEGSTTLLSPLVETELGPCL